MIVPRLELLLLDFDGLLAQYSHPARIAHLARASGCPAAQVAEVLFASGLEAEYVSGRIDTVGYLARLGAGLGHAVDEAAWIASRVAGSRADPAVIAQVQSVATHTPVAVLSNNGALVAEAMRAIVAPLFPALEGRVLCSGTLGARKPDTAVFERALAHFGVAASRVLFVDDLFANVRGAWRAGLHADTARDARSLRRVLGRYGLQHRPGPT